MIICRSISDQGCFISIIVPNDQLLRNLSYFNCLHSLPVTLSKCTKVMRTSVCNWQLADLIQKKKNGSKKFHGQTASKGTGLRMSRQMHVIFCIIHHCERLPLLGMVQRRPTLFRFNFLAICRMFILHIIHVNKISM